MSPREKLLRITLNEQELADIREAAEKAGLPPATWVRMAALQAARKDQV